MIFKREQYNGVPNKKKFNYILLQLYEVMPTQANQLKK